MNPIVEGVVEKLALQSKNIYRIVINLLVSHVCSPITFTMGSYKFEHQAREVYQEILQKRHDPSFIYWLLKRYQKDCRDPGNRTCTLQFVLDEVPFENAYDEWSTVGKYTFWQAKSVPKPCTGLVKVFQARSKIIESFDLVIDFSLNLEYYLQDFELFSILINE